MAREHRHGGASVMPDRDGVRAAEMLFGGDDG